MKAWLISVKSEFYSEVVFAETRGKAKSLALITDSFEDANFIDIEVHRMPHLDKYYEDGKWRFDWYNPQDRTILVKEANFICSDETLDYIECCECPAKEYCSKYVQFKEEEAN